MPTHKIANIRDAFLVLPPSNEVCEGYVFTSVCHSVHRGGCLSQCMLGYTPPGADTPSPRSRNPPGADTAWYQTPQEQTHPQEQTPPPEQTPPAQCMQGDTGNKGAVRILLECILGSNKFMLISPSCICRIVSIYIQYFFLITQSVQC